MTRPLTDADLDAIEVRAKAATPGPWSTTPDNHGVMMAFETEGEGVPVTGRVLSQRIVHAEAEGMDTAWIPGWPDDHVPTLAAEVRRLRIELDELRDAALERLASLIEFIEPDRIERTDDGKARFVHADDCPGFCDCACAAQGERNGESIGERFAEAVNLVDAYHKRTAPESTP